MGLRNANRIGWLPMSVLLLAALALAQVPAGDDAAWEQELLKERAEKDAEFRTSPTSPMAGCERLTLPATRPVHLVRDGRVVASTPAGDGPVLALLFKDGQWFWSGTPGVACRRGERPVAMEQEPLAQGDLFTAGRRTLAAYPGADTLALIVFDPQRPQRLEFKHLLYYAPDRGYAVKARLERFVEPKPLKVITTRQLEKTFYRFGRVHFRLQGKELALTALKTSLEGPDAGYLFIPFKDASNGGETYEVGRFLDVPEPAATEFILDFNRCYNPLCNYSPAYNCPMPPLENFLDVAVPAGEKAYPHYKE